MSWACGIDCEPNSFYVTKQQTARKAHACSYCGGVIKPGTRYEMMRAGYPSSRPFRGSRSGALIFKDVRADVARKYPRVEPHHMFEDCFEVCVEKYHKECESLMRLAAEYICGETSLVFGSNLDGASHEILALEDDYFTGSEREDWMMAYGEILEAHCL